MNFMLINLQKFKINAEIIYNYWNIYFIYPKKMYYLFRNADLKEYYKKELLDAAFNFK